MNDRFNTQQNVKLIKNALMSDYGCDESNEAVRQCDFVTESCYHCDSVFVKHELSRLKTLMKTHAGVQYDEQWSKWVDLTKDRLKFEGDVSLSDVSVTVQYRKLIDEIRSYRKKYQPLSDSV